MSETIDPGFYHQVSYAQLISSAKAELKIETSDYDIVMDRWINEGIRHIDALNIFSKCTAVLPITDKTAELPCGFFRMIALTLGGNGANCASAVYVDMPFLQSCGCAPVWNSTGTFTTQGLYEIQDGRIYFHSNTFYSTVAVDGSITTTEVVPYTHCTIAYFGFLVDDDGLLKAYQDMERALTAYVCWRYSRQNFKEYPQYIQQSYYQEWCSQKKWLKSIAFQNDFRNTRRQIAEIVNSLVSDKVFLP